MRPTSILWALVLLGACGPSVDDVVARDRPSVNARIAAINGLTAAVASAPACESAHLELPPGTHIDLRATLIPGLESNHYPNALLLHAEDLPVGPRMPTHLPLRIDGSENRVFQAARSFAQPDQYTTTEGLTVYRTLLERARYLLIVRNGVYTPPRQGEATLDRNETGGLDTNTEFEPGRYRAEALVLAIDGGRVLGCFPFEAESREFRIEGATAGDLVGLADGSLLVHQLATEAKASLVRALNRVDPGAQFECVPHQVAGIQLQLCPE